MRPSTKRAISGQEKKMARTLHLRVLTPAETLLEVEGVKRVHLRLVNGTGISVYPGHTHLLAETLTAPVRYTDDSGEHTFNAEAGIVQVDDDGIMVFTSGSQESPETTELPAVAQERKFERLARAFQYELEEEPRDLLMRDDEET